MPDSNIEAERQQLIEQAEREQEQILHGLGSPDLYAKMSSDQDATRRGIDELIRLAHDGVEASQRTHELLLRILGTRE